MKKIFHAIEISLFEVTADVNADGAVVDPSRTRREAILQHYRGDLAKGDAQRVFAQCDHVLKAGAR